MSFSVKSPGTAVSDATIGIVPWNNPGNIVADDGSYAMATFNYSSGSHSSHSQYLKATNYGFAIPSDAMVNGIKVEIDRKGTVINYTDVAEEYVKIVKGGTIGAVNKSTNASLPAVEAYATYGGATDKWGETWAPADINNANFGVVFAVSFYDDSSSAPYGYVDHIRITVYYDLQVSTGGATITPVGGIAQKAFGKSVGNAVVSPDGWLDNGTTESGTAIAYDFTIGPTTLGINNREKRLRWIYLVLSKAAETTMFVSYAMSEEGAFNAPIEIAPGTEISMVRKYIPLAVGESSNGIVLRIRVRGVGIMTVHDVGVEVSVRGV